MNTVLTAKVGMEQQHHVHFEGRQYIVEAKLNLNTRFSSGDSRRNNEATLSTVYLYIYL